jgi:hypothetical protein
LKCGVIYLFRHIKRVAIGLRGFCDNAMSVHKLRYNNVI